MILYYKSNSKVNMEPSSRMHLIRLHGIIDEPMANRFIERFSSFPNGDGVAIHIESIGGDLAQAWKITQLIEQRKHELEIVTIGYRNVHSAALHIFIAGTYRFGQGCTQYLIHLPEPDGTEQGKRSISFMREHEIIFFAEKLKKPKGLILELMNRKMYLTSAQVQMLGITNF